MSTCFVHNVSYNRTEKNTLMATCHFVSVEVSGGPKLAKVNRCVSQTTSLKEERIKAVMRKIMEINILENNVSKMCYMNLLHLVLFSKICQVKVESAKNVISRSNLEENQKPNSVEKTAIGASLQKLFNDVLNIFRFKENPF